MANAMHPAALSAFAQSLPEKPLHESAGGYEFEFQRSPDSIQVTAERGTDRASGTIHWVLGAGAQGETPLIATAAGTLESRISFFPQLPRYGITIGQHAADSTSAQAALGRLQTREMLAQCLGCHATAVTRDLEPVVPGVQCQRCHAGAEAHLANPAAHHPVNPGKLSAPAQVEFCGTCHRFRLSGPPDAIENVRFQPYRLAMSRCFSSGKLSCTTCHAAHQDARRNDNAFYNQRCVSCHTQPHRSGDCISCHMPRVQLHPALAFTDHYIR
ncbi:MAG TPA: hypothetical protein VKX25_09055 [Bryobacteraceae bacterium]|jgi:hypothetical protein|nr:hypothetical protein [Bryobacteraceae bacterium]